MFQEHRFFKHQQHLWLRVFYYSLQTNVRTWEKSSKLQTQRQWNLNEKERRPPPQMSAITTITTVTIITPITTITARRQPCLRYVSKHVSSEKRHNLYKLNSALPSLGREISCNGFDFLGKEDLAPRYPAKVKPQMNFLLCPPSCPQSPRSFHFKPDSSHTGQGFTRCDVLRSRLTWASCLGPEVSYWCKVSSMIILWVPWPLYNL